MEKGEKRVLKIFFPHFFNVATPAPYTNLASLPLPAESTRSLRDAPDDKENTFEKKKCV